MIDGNYAIKSVFLPIALFSPVRQERIGYGKFHGIKYESTSEKLLIDGKYYFVINSLLQNSRLKMHKECFPHL